MKLRNIWGSALMLTCAAAQAQAGLALIDQEQFGDNWPFTPPEMHLSCLPGKAVVVMDVESGVMYPLNGSASQQAKRHGMAALSEIWRDNPRIPGTKVSVNPVINRGLQLCK